MYILSNDPLVTIAARCIELISASGKCASAAAEDLVYAGIANSSLCVNRNLYFQAST